MALRRREKNDRQLNKRNVRRPGGRTAEFFDLRETDTDTGSDRSSGQAYAGGGRGGSFYAENRGGSSYGGSRDTGSYGGGRSNSPYGGSRDTGSYGGGRGSSPYADGTSAPPYRERHRVEVNSRTNGFYGPQETAQTYGSDPDYYGGQQRIVRGNTPGNRSGQTQRSYAGESSPELLYDSRTGGSGRRDRRSADRSSDSYRSRNSSDSTGGSYRNRSYADRSFDEFYDDGYDTSEDGYGTPDEETVERREVLGRRLRERAQARKAREQELRGTYIRIGAAGLILLLLLIFIVPRIVGGLRSGKKDPEQEQTVAQAQDSAETEAEDDQTQIEAQNQTQTPADRQDAPETEAVTADGQAENAAEDTPADAESIPAGQEDNTVQETGTPENSAEEAQTPEKDDAAQQAQEGSAQTGQEDTGTQDAAARNAAAQTAGSDTPVAVSGAPDQTAAESGLYTRQDDWRFILVNPWYTLPEEYAEVTTSSLPNGESVDTRCYSEFVKMLDDCRAAGGEPVVCSSYRPHTKQVALYEDQIKELMAEGKTKEQAEAEAGTEVAVPGTSEHELGLAVDLCDYDYQNLDDAQADTVTQKWLMQHCWEYGFILRYPKDKTAVTGIIYEPWHYRYVGKEAAEEITKKGICLEEYLAVSQ